MEHENALLAVNSRKGDRTLRNVVLAFKADTLMLRGEVMAAAGLCEEILASRGQEGFPVPVMVFAPLLSLVKLNTHKLVEAKDARARAHIVRDTLPILKRLRRVGTKFMLRYPEALRIIGVFHRVAGECEEAIRRLKDGLVVAERLGIAPEIGRILFELAKLLARPGGRTRSIGGREAADLAREARQTFVELGLKADLEDLDGWVAQRSGREHSPEPGR